MHFFIKNRWKRKLEKSNKKNEIFWFEFTCYLCDSSLCVASTIEPRQSLSFVVHLVLYKFFKIFPFHSDMKVTIKNRNDTHFTVCIPLVSDIKFFIIIICSRSLFMLYSFFKAQKRILKGFWIEKKFSLFAFRMH